MADFDQEKLGVGAGWQQIVADLHQALTELLGPYEIWQIKEKFGGLRYYCAPTVNATDEQIAQMNHLIELAEERSTITCEVCGKPGSTGVTEGGHWVKTLCDLHRAEEAERIVEKKAQVPSDRSDH